MEAMLDEPLPLSTTGNAPGEFLVGKIPSKDGAYHVVILARCDVAENLAATNATILFERFPQLDRVLVVGIAGAAPDPTKPENDVHLGDIVVSNEVGVIQYDYEKEILRGEAEVIHESRHPPRPPSARLLSAAKDLEVQDLKGESRWEANTARARLPWTDRPAFPDELHALDDPTEILSRSADSMTHERGSLIAAAARLPPPAKKGNPVGKLFGPESKLGSTEAENLVIRQIRSAIHAPNYRVDLAVLCQVATALGKEKQITEMAERVRSAAKILGHDVSYGEDGISAAREFDDTDWILIRDRPPHALAIHGQVGAMTRQRLITRISSNPYYFWPRLAPEAVRTLCPVRVGRASPYPPGH